MPIDFIGFINATVPVGWSDEKKLRLRESFIRQNGYEDMIHDNEGDWVPNPVSKTDWANRAIQEWIVSCIKAWEAKEDAEAARLATIDEVDTEFGDWES